MLITKVMNVKAMFLRALLSLGVAHNALAECVALDGVPNMRYETCLSQPLQGYEGVPAF